jgi:hypothetical protein
MLSIFDIKGVKMKNIIIAAVVASFGVVSQAVAQDIDTLLFSRPGGLMGRTMDVVEGALGNRHGERVVVKGCAAAIEYLKNTDRPTIAAAYPDMQAGENNPCAVELDTFHGYLGASPFYLCVREENKEGAVDRLMNDDVLIGYADWAWIRQQSNRLAAEISPKVKAVPYKNSKAYRAALAAGEIDFMVSSLGKDGEFCPVILAPELQNDAIVTGGELVPNGVVIKDFSYSTYLIGANIPNDGEIQSLVLGSDAWSNRVDNRYEAFMTDSNLVEQFKHLNN